MKNRINHTARVVTLLLGVLMLAWAGSAAAQEDEGPKKERTRHRLNVYQLADSIRYLRANIYTSGKGDRTDVAGAEVGFYMLTDTGEVLLLTATTGPDGMAIAELPPSEKLVADTGGYYAFVSRFDGDKNYRGSEADVRFRELHLELVAEEEDSSKSLLARLTDPATGEGVEGVAVHFYVERMFRPLKIGEEESDRKGRARVEFPADLPAGPDGSVYLSVRVEDSEVYGNVEAVSTLDWGVPVPISEHRAVRALWGPNAPLWMVITFIILMGTVWGHYVAIAVLLKRIGKLREPGDTALVWEE